VVHNGNIIGVIIAGIILGLGIIIPVEAQIQGHIPESDDKIIIVEHTVIKYPRFENEAVFMADTLFPLKGNQPYYIEGDVVNVSDVTLDKIIIKVRFYEGSKMREEVTAMPIKSVLRPGDTSYFSIYAPYHFLSCYDFWIESYEILEEEEKIMDVLEIQEFVIDKHKPDFDSKVKNKSDKSLVVWFFVFGYEEDGKQKFGIVAEPERIPPGKTKPIDFWTDSKWSAMINPELLDLFKADNYDAIALAYEFDSEYAGAGTKSDRWLPIKTIYQSKYYSNATSPKYIDFSNLSLNKESNCADQEKSKTKIPDWIRNNAEWWAQGAIGDSDFVSGIQYLIKEGVMQIPETAKASTAENSQEIPSWIKNNADWWAQGLISDDDFIKGIQYLVEQGIIRV